MKSKKVRYAVVGLGHIAQVAVLPAFKGAAKNSELVALVSGDSKKLKKLSKKYHADAYAYGDYDSLVRSQSIDAVYVCTPNTLHQEFVEKAAEAGVNILCEKPLAADVKSCLSMVKSVSTNRVKAMTAYRLHFEEANLRAIEIGRSGKLGDIRFMSADFGFEITDPENIRLNYALGGGTLFDIGIYCINAARYLMRAEPIEVFAMMAAKDDRRFDDVEEMTSVILRFPNNRLATFNVSFGSAPVSTYRLIGTKGDLVVDNAFEYAEGIKHHLTINEKTKTKTFPKRDQFAAEISYFSNCILKNRRPEPSFEEGLLDIEIIEALYESARTGSSVSMDYRGSDTKRPTIIQELKMPAHSKPRVIGARSPHS